MEIDFHNESDKKEVAEKSFTNEQDFYKLGNQKEGTGNEDMPIGETLHNMIRKGVEEGMIGQDFFTGLAKEHPRNFEQSKGNNDGHSKSKSEDHLVEVSKDDLTKP